MSTEWERRVSRAEALVVEPNPSEPLPETEETVERAAFDIEELYRVRDGRVIDVDALIDTYLDGGVEAVEQAFDADTAQLLARRIRSYRIPPRNDGYAVRLSLLDEDI